MVLYKDGKTICLFSFWQSSVVDDIIALNKPAGLAVHGGPRIGSDLTHYLHYWQYDESQPPQLAHRLDKLVFQHAV